MDEKEDERPFKPFSYPIPKILLSRSASLLFLSFLLSLSKKEKEREGERNFIPCTKMQRGEERKTLRCDDRDETDY